MKAPASCCVNPAVPSDGEQSAMALYTCRLLLSPTAPKARSYLARDCLFPLIPFLVWPEAVAGRYARHVISRLNQYNESAEDPKALVAGKSRAWLLRLLYEGDELLSKYDTPVDAIYEYFDDNRADARRVMQATTRRMEALGDLKPDSASGIAHYARMMGLGQAHTMVLYLMGLMGSSGHFRNSLRSCDIRSLRHGCEIIADILRVPPADVTAALSAGGVLVRLGVVEQSGLAGDLEDILRGTDALQALSSRRFETEEQFVESLVSTAEPGTLCRADFPHLEAHTETLVRLVAKAVTANERGINILLHGGPGTGKTEFAKVLASEIGARLHEVRKCDDDGTAPTLDGRLASLQVAQQYLKTIHSSLVLFDEAEDLFRSDGSDFGMLFGLRMPGKGGRSKAWLNEALETNPVPVVWITNRVYQIDEAYLRRFQYHLEFRQPPRAVRERIARRHMEALPFGEQLAARVAGYANVSPADIARAARLVALAAPATAAEAEAMVARQLDQAFRAAGEPVVEERRNVATAFDSEFVNAKLPVPLSDWTQALKRVGRGSILLYGPPGTGKTSLVEHLARDLGLTLVRRSASDLISKWIGETEKNIAAMFEEAEAEGALLFLDEADSFLQERARADRSWEISQVNEMLQRMERFPGMFICATNLVDTLDKASLRRFAWKVEFRPLEPGQRVGMFARFALGADSAAPRENHVQRLHSLDDLTPGDFAAVVSRLAMLGGVETDPERFLEALEAECQIKRGTSGGRSVGFLASVH